MMKKTLILTVAALAATLSACSHGSGSAVPSGAPQSSAAASQSAPLGALTKQAMLDQEKSVAANAWRAPKHPGFLPAQAGPEERTLGISERGLPGGANAFSNRYDYTGSDGHYVTVLAGARKSDGSGIVTIVDRSPDFRSFSTRTYTVAPSAVRVESAQGGQVQLQTLAGNTRIPFDVNAVVQ
ncbi:MAG: hypothetical protein ABR584_02935 [Candidatus Baltobacteraceae bacterium]